MRWRLHLVSNKSEAMEKAAGRALAALEGADLARRCESLGLAPPSPDGRLRVRMLGRDIEYQLPKFGGSVAGSDRQVHPVDRLLLLHCLQCDLPVTPTGEWTTFRQFPGGQFYWQPFLSRTVEPLVREIGDDLALLRDRLSCLDWAPVDMADLAARIRVLGKVEILLIYRKSCEGFGARADILFDSSLKRVFPAEDALALAGRVCRRLTPSGCAPCIACGLCEAALTQGA